ncbi:aminopeptidase [Trichosporon asahii var. asahii CBS 8904]|uniref:Peptide hydrolase n=1 Tax=Trichosporon asahii var. asahii (strain CBS 8904) TaxID=1220162 RepID=K1W8A3_TRIAC|nr:aminopeptidase [Trichosporon asahii var. asahii CBS 8904]
MGSHLKRGSGARSRPCVPSVPTLPSSPLLMTLLEEHDCGQLQKSLIVQLPSQNDGAVTILGAHQDSIGSHSVTSDPYGPEVPAPGAEDNGSGVASLLDALRVLSLRRYQPQTPLEFHFYAAEEISRMGSKAIAKSYKEGGVKVRGMMNLDMTGYCPDEGNVTFAVSTAQTDEGLSTWTKQAIAAYREFSSPSSTDTSPRRAPNHLRAYGKRPRLLLRTWVSDNHTRGRRAAQQRARSPGTHHAQGHGHGGPGGVLVPTDSAVFEAGCCVRGRDDLLSVEP